MKWRCWLGLHDWLPRFVLPVWHRGDIRRCQRCRKGEMRMAHPDRWQRLP